jgi:hypothetical protein
VIRWNQESLKQFEKVKNLVSNLPTLYFIGYEKPIRLYTDASDYGIGAYLCQVHVIDGITVEQPICFLSKTLNTTQQRWSTIEKECYAIYYAFQQFEYLIRDIKFTLYTDHRNLLYLNNQASQKVVRWKLAVQHYDFSIYHIQGKNNIVADNFSRLCAHEELNIFEESRVALTPEDGRIISQYHNAIIGHGGIDRTYELMKISHNNIRYLKSKIHEYIKLCPLCQRLSEIKYPIHAHRFTSSSYAPMERIAIDAIGPLNPSANGDRFILVIIDCFTRWCELYPIKDVSAISAAEALIQFCGRFGYAHQLVSDRGSQFINEIITELLNILQIEHNLSISYSKEEISIVERCNKEVLRHLRAILLNPKITNWSVYRWYKGLSMLLLINH